MHNGAVKFHHEFDGAVSLLSPVNPLCQALLHYQFEIESYPGLLQEHFVDYWDHEQVVSYKKDTLPKSLTILEFAVSLGFYDAALPKMLAEIQDDNIFFDRAKQSVLMAEALIEQYQASAYKQSGLVKAELKKMISGRVKIGRQIQDREKKVAESHTIIRRNLINRHEASLQILLSSLEPINDKYKLRVLLKGSEIYFPGLGQDLDIYFGIDPVIFESISPDEIMSEFKKVLSEAGFVISHAHSASQAPKDKSKLIPIKVSHHDIAIPFDIGICSLPLPPMQALKALEPEWQFNLSSGFVVVYLGPDKKVVTGAFMSPQSVLATVLQPIREHGSILLKALQKKSLSDEDLGFLLKLCCKLKINLQVGHNADGVLIGAEKYRVKLDKSLYEQLQEIYSSQPALLKKALIKILNCYFQARPLAFHQFLIQNHLLDMAFDMAKNSFASLLESEIFQLVLKPGLSGRAYICFLVNFYLLH
ncbi:MAG: hypothetical protein K0S29_634 [Gammaproteobacteria bacterium]|nr:hypothetical protein [Gammaproteobacteria bacterium]